MIYCNRNEKKFSESLKITYNFNPMKDSSDYLTNDEYKEIFVNFCFFREKVISELKNFGILDNHFVLDFAAGHGFLSFALKKSKFTNFLICIGLENDAESFKKVRELDPKSKKEIQYCIMDATKMALRENVFESIINFLGLEDICMISRRKGVLKTLNELCRIIKKDGILEISILKKGSTPSDILNWKLWKYIGLNSIFFKPRFYIKNLKNLGFNLEKKFVLKTHKKMTLEQAEEEIKFACEEAPKVFSKYNVKAKSFKKVWAKFNYKISKYGLGFYPKILVLFFRKVI